MVQAVRKQGLLATYETVKNRLNSLTPLGYSISGDVVAVAAYRTLREGRAGLGILFQYPAGDDTSRETVRTSVVTRAAEPAKEIVLGCIGAGNYANTKLLPFLTGHTHVRPKTVVTASSASGKSTARRFGFEQAATDPDLILGDSDINTVLIATPHDSHATLVSEALMAGKNVFVEKPLAINAEQLENVREALVASGNERLQVGFNRRFAPLTMAVKEAFGDVRGELAVLIRINAGAGSTEGWGGDPEVSGGRFVGECCHFLDLASFIIGEDPSEIAASRTGRDPDAITAHLRYPGGSTAVIVYTVNGSPLMPKEYLEVMGGGRAAVVDDFKHAVIYGEKKRRIRSISQDKGQRKQMAAFVRAILEGENMPIASESVVATTEATLIVAESLKTGQFQSLGKWL